MPAEQIPGVSGSSGVGAQSVSTSHTNDPFLYNTNYILLVMKYTNIAMEHQANLVAMQGQLENVVTQIQGCLSTISEFFSTMQAQAASGGAWWTHELFGGDQYAPNANNGLNYNFYHMDEGQNIGSDSQTGDVSKSYQQSMSSFVNAFKELFDSSSEGSGPTVGSLSTIANPFGGVCFNMQTYYTQLASGTFNPLNLGGLMPVSTDPGAHASLLQQYMYYQAQLTVNTDSGSTVNAAAGDISNLVNFDPDSENGGCDPNVSALWQILSDLNTTVTVGRDSSAIGSSVFINNTAGTGSSDGILGLIAAGDYNNMSTGKAPDGQDIYDPGLYAAFSYMSFNYIWTKNPTMAVTQQASNDPNSPTFGGSIWAFNSSTSGDTNADGSTSNGDVLSDLYSNTSSSQTSLSSSGSQGNSTFQEQVNGVQQEQNVAQNMISGWASAMTSVVGNWKNA